MNSTVTKTHHICTLDVPCNLNDIQEKAIMHNINVHVSILMSHDGVQVRAQLLLTSLEPCIREAL